MCEEGEIEGFSAAQLLVGLGNKLELEYEVTVPKELIPIHKLLAAILSRAIMDIYTHVPLEEEIAKEWLYSKEIAPWSASWIFDHLDLDREKFLTALEVMSNHKSILRGLVYDR